MINLERLFVSGCVLAGAFAAPFAVARDPGPLDATGRQPAPSSATRQPPSFAPEHADTRRLHGPVPKPREHRRLYERVEDDVDRGAGRIQDRQAYETRLRQDDRDERGGRIVPRRESDRILEETDRTRRLDARADRGAAARPARGSRSTSRYDSIVAPVIPPGPLGSPLARVVSEDEHRLSETRVRYQDELRQAEAGRDEAIRAAGPNRPARAAATRSFEQRRSALTVAYQAARRRILGMP